MHRACHDLALDLLYRQPKHGEQIRETGEMKMSIQKKSLIGNLTAAKKAIVAALDSAGAVEGRAKVSKPGLTEAVPNRLNAAPHRVSAAPHRVAVK